MTDTTPIDAAEAAARALLDARLAPIRDLAAAKQEREDLLAKLATVDKEYARAYTAAQSAGWSPDELHKLDYAEPTKRGPGRPARGRSVPTRRTTRKAPAPPTSVPEQRDQNPEGTDSGSSVAAADAGQ
jgi:hypothetical protein